VKRRQKRFLLSNHSGVIMIVSLWILIILSILAVGLGRRTRINLTLAKYSVAKTQSDYLAWAGINYALNQITNSALNETDNQVDTLYYCGIYPNEENEFESNFQDVKLESGDFRIGYFINSTEGQDEDFCYALEDESRRININALNIQNYKAFSYLLGFLGVEASFADEISFSLVDWRDSDDEASGLSSSGEDDFYMSKNPPYHCKNSNFDSIEELLLIKSIDLEMFKKLKKYVTIFPKQDNDLFININTASEIVLKSFFYASVEDNPNASFADVDSLIAKIINYRQGSDGRPCTSDDQTIVRTDLSSLALNSIEQVIFLNASGKIKEKADFYRIHSIGKSFFLSVSSKIETVVSKESLSIGFWSQK